MMDAKQQGLLDGWAASVLRLKSEAVESEKTVRDFWGPYDLVGAYHHRSRLEASRTDGFASAIDAVDELLRSFSEDIGSSWVRSIGLGEEAGDQWWWNFVPRIGPLRSELDDRLGRGSI